MTIGSEDTRSTVNPELVAALRAARQNPTPDALATLSAALTHSTLILPVPEDLIPEATEDLKDDAENEAPIPLVTFEDDLGASVLIAFTDENAALAWEPESMAYVGLRGLDLVLLAVEHKINSIALNPGNPEAWQLGPDQIAALAEGRELPAGLAAPASALQGITVLISPPDEKPPSDWQEAVQEILTGYPSVEAAYFFTLHAPPEASQTVIGLALYRDMAPEAQDRLVEAMLAEFAERLPEGLTLEFVILDEEDFLQSVQDAVPPLFVRDANT